MLRASTLLLILCLTLSGCGVVLRIPPAPLTISAPTTAAVPPDPVLPRPHPVLPPVSADPLILAPGQTAVSLTFDDGRASNAQAAQTLTAHGLSATFFLNSGQIGRPGFLSLPEVDAIAASGHEIGGHTATHPDLSVFTADEIRRQVCEDRKMLLGWGFPVRSFAYPFASTTPEAEQIVRECGYNSGRSLGELWGPRPTDGLPPEVICASCDTAEDLPPVDPWYTKAPAQVRANWTVADLQTQVNAAITRGDGWLQLTFHGICGTDCSDIAVSQAVFDKFIPWLVDQQDQGRIVVRPVGDVIGGPVAPPVSGPPPTTTVVNADMEATQDGVPSCWMPASFGHNSPVFDLVPWSRSGRTASRLVMHNYVDGDAKLMQTEDLGTCALAVTPGTIYTLQAWYTSTVPTSFTVQYRLARGTWVYGTASPKFNPANEYTRAHWTMPPIPEEVTAISFGLALSQNGELVTDDYALLEKDTPP
jgi:peptidoglycan/xylan/chitin deacetylase (PgdA/CDA1 family)